MYALAYIHNVSFTSLCEPPALAQVRDSLVQLAKLCGAPQSRYDDVPVTEDEAGKSGAILFPGGSATIHYYAPAKRLSVSVSTSEQFEMERVLQEVDRLRGA